MVKRIARKKSELWAKIKKIKRKNKENKIKKK